MTNVWVPLKADHTPRNGACSGAIGTQLYIAGGIHDTWPVLRLTESFNLSQEGWRKLAPMPHATAVGNGSAVYEGRLYCFGGHETGYGNVLSNVQIYQP
jgi:N-acetylneuraminic acid mutarotase